MPDFDRYPGSAINFDRLIIGYGYSKNSLKIDFSGELILSQKLIEDADSSDEVGVGIILPRNSKVQFNIDLIPIVLGEVDFLLPLVAFDIDLRSDIPLPAAINNGVCQPVWDGLQLHIPNVLRTGLKKAAYSPFFGPILAQNNEYAFDIELGNEQYGLRHIADYRSIGPIANVLPIPFFADGVPFFQQLCSSIRLGGFALNFD